MATPADRANDAAQSDIGRRQVRSRSRSADAGPTGAWLLLTPFLAGTAVLVAFPALLTLGLAFTEFDALSPPVWLGMENFAEIAEERLFWTAIANSTFFVLLAVPLRTLAALALALLLLERRPGIGTCRAAVFLPTVIPDVAYALIWLWVLNPFYGPLNLILAALGLPQPAWLADADWALPALVLMALFQIGEGFVILLAGLQHAPQDCYEAGTIDGAGRWQKFRYITLPLLMPWLLLLTVRDVVVSAQNVFTPALLMTGGGPYYATLVVPLLVFEEAFDRFRFGQGSAIMVAVYAGLGLLLLLAYRLVRARVYADEV